MLHYLFATLQDEDCLGADCCRETILEILLFFGGTIQILPVQLEKLCHKLQLGSNNSLVFCSL
jgi:hypothetical protein